MKSNGGTLVVDDFGRQRVEPHELLNRWILPLEKRVDYLTFQNGKKIEVPFEQLVIGAKVRIGPNHACITAAAHDRYYVVDGGIDVIAEWDRINGWTEAS